MCAHVCVCTCVVYVCALSTYELSPAENLLTSIMGTHKNSQQHRLAFILGRNMTAGLQANNRQY